MNTNLRTAMACFSENLDIIEQRGTSKEERNMYVGLKALTIGIAILEEEINSLKQHVVHLRDGELVHR